MATGQIIAPMVRTKVLFGPEYSMETLPTQPIPQTSNYWLLSLRTSRPTFKTAPVDFNLAFEDLSITQLIISQSQTIARIPQLRKAEVAWQIRGLAFRTQRLCGNL